MAALPTYVELMHKALSLKIYNSDDNILYAIKWLYANRLIQESESTFTAKKLIKQYMKTLPL